MAWGHHKHIKVVFTQRYKWQNYLQWLWYLPRIEKEGLAERATESTIRNCDKVKTWLDQMFRQIYQKLRLSGFLSSGNLCLTHHFKLFWPHVASTASGRKSAKIQHFLKKLPYSYALIITGTKIDNTGNF